MNVIVVELIAKLGLDLALLVLKNLSTVTTIQDAIAALEKTKTAQEYVDADAAARGVPSVPLPTP
jgi:hypothetical protein